MTRFLICIGVVVLSVMLFCVGVAAQADASLTGTIRDQNGAVVVNAGVQLLNIASGRPLKTKTDASGKYGLTGVPLGAYQLSVGSEGFADATRSLALRRAGSYVE